MAHIHLYSLTKYDFESAVIRRQCGDFVPKIGGKAAVSVENKTSPPVIRLFLFIL